MLVARQNGKTSLLEIKNLWKMYVLRVLLVLGTAQKLEYAEESWDKAVEIAEAIPDLAAEIKHVDKTNGKKSLRLLDGPRWKVAAASRKGGRSLSADDVNLDELREHQNWESWGAVTKTTMARPNPQVFAYSNAGDDKSIVLNELQAKGRAAAENPDDADDLSFGHFEWSAPDDVVCTCGRPEGKHPKHCKLWDPAAHAQANPSLNRGGVTDEAIAAALGTDPVKVFRTEVLCQHVEDLAEEWQVIPEAEWSAAGDPGSKPRAPVSFSLEVDLLRSEACITVAARRRGKKALRHVEIADLRPGTSWAVQRMVQLSKKWRPVAVVVDSGGPAGSLIADLEAAGIEVLKPAVRDLAAACGAMYDGIAGSAKDGEDLAAVRNIRHTGQGQLTAAIATLTPRNVAETAVWERSGLGYRAVGAALALWGLAKKLPSDYDPLQNIW